MTSSLSTFQKLTQGISLKRNGKTDEQKEEESKVDHFTVNKESFDLNDEDKLLFNESLKFIKTHQMLNDASLLKEKSEAETKAIHRKREALGKFLKQNNMKINGDHAPLPILDFKEFVK